MQIRCPNCQNPIEIVEDSEFDSLHCDSCDSNFSLLTEETLSLNLSDLGVVAHFQLVDRLGVGAFGTVWKAKDTKLDRTVALKIPRKSHLSDQESELFFREARAAAQLKHPNIVGIHEVGKQNDTIYIVSDYVEGADLKKWVRHRPLPPREAAEVCSTVAQALHHAHEAGIIHRDLKPENILMDLKGNPYITDFGLAKREALETSMTVDGQILGTPAYMPPEQARGKGHLADRRADVYSLGVILFQLLTGEAPFRGDKSMLIVQILEDDPPRPRKLVQRIPKDLETICLKCLQKDPAGRYQTSQELADDLKRFLENRPIVAKPVSTLERGIRWCRRRPAIAALLISLAVTIVAGVSGVVWQWREAVAAALRESQAREEAVLKEQLASDAAAREEAANEQLSRQLYASKMTIAGYAFQEESIPRTRALLQTLSEESDELGFEWQYLWQRCNPHQSLLSGHEGGVEAIAYSAQRDTLATADRSGAVRYWKLSSGEKIRDLNRPPSKVIDLQFESSGELLGVACEEGRIEIWDTDTDRLIHEFELSNSMITDLAFDPSRRHVAVSFVNLDLSEGIVRIWDVDSGDVVHTFPAFSYRVGSIGFSSDGRRLAAAESNELVNDELPNATVRIWDADDFSLKTEYQTSIGHRLAIMFQPESQMLIGVGMDTLRGKSAIAYWDAESGEVQSSVDLGLALAGSLAVSTDGGMLAVGHSRAISIWKLGEELEQVRRFEAHSDLISSLSFCQNDELLASAGVLVNDNVKLWELEPTPNPVQITRHTGWVKSVAFSPDGRFLASAGQRIRLDGVSQVLLHDAESWELVAGANLPSIDVNDLAYSPDGALLAAACDDKTIRVFDSEDMSLKFTLRSRDISVSHVAFSADSQFLVSADGQYRRLSPDGRYFDNYSRAGELRIWDVAEGELLTTLDPFQSAITAVEFSADGEKLAIAMENGVVELWDWATREQVHSFQAFESSATAIAFSPTASILAVAGANKSENIRGKVILYDVDSYVERNTIVAHDDAVTAMAYTPNGEALATSTLSGRIRFWDPDHGYERLLLKSSQLNDLAFSPDGRKLAAAATNKSIQVMWHDE